MKQITKRTVDSAPLPKRRPGETDTQYAKRSAWLGDAEVRGFGLRTFGSGKQTWAIRYRARGRRSRMLTLGAVGELTVQQARAKAREEKVRILAGHDPQHEKERAREAAGLATVADLVNAWLTDYAAIHRRGHKDDNERAERHVLPKLGRVHLVDVSVQRLGRWHRDIGAASPVEANRSLELLRACWRWGLKEKRLPVDAPDASMFQGGKDAPVKRFPERSRTRWLREEELGRLMAAVRAESDPQVRAIVPLLVLTGLRRSELLNATWPDVDLERGEIRLPTTKSGEEQSRILPPAAVAILRGLPRAAESDYVFPSPANQTKPRDGIKAPWQRIRKAAGLPDVTIHDLRRTCGSLMAQRGVPVQHIGDVLGHARNEAVTRIYSRLSSDTRRAALGTLSDALSDVLGLAKPDDDGAEALPDQLRALLEATEDDPEAFAAGLRKLGLGKAVEA